jgi:hypothetical protein
MNKQPLSDHRKSLLMAIAEGSTIQDMSETGWVVITESKALHLLACGGGNFLRVKPKLMRYYGQDLVRPETARPESMKNPARVSVLLYRGVNQSCNAEMTYWFTDGADAATVYNAIVNPFNIK